METPYCNKNLGKFGYSLNPMSPPPAETKSNVIQFSLTEGCSHSACTFCDMYEKKGYKVKTLHEFMHHVDDVIDSLSSSELRGIDRIFVGAGNALSVETNELMRATQYALLKVKKATREIPRRLAVYGNTKDILNKGEDALEKLRCGGTCGKCSTDVLGERRGVDVIYWGIESGNSDVLKMAGKGYEQKDIFRASRLINQVKIKTSVMIIPGLGGIKYFDEHVMDTAVVLSQLKPEWITFMGIEMREGVPYTKIMKNEMKKNNNRPLAPKEIVEQTAQIIENIHFNTILGIHGNDVHPTGFNPIPLGTRELSYFDSNGKDVAEELRKLAKKNSRKLSKLEKSLF
ncbi:MAG: radical SAM protein [Candidatus Pacearchaeota archaeon]